MKKQISSLILTLTMLTSVSIVAPLSANANTSTVQYTYDSGMLYKISPLNTVDGFKIIGSRSYCDNIDVSGRTLYVENECIIELAEYVGASIFCVSAGTTLEQFCAEVWDENTRSYTKTPDYVFSNFPPYEQGSLNLSKGTYVVETEVAGDGLYTLLIVGDSVPEKEISVYLNNKKIEFDVLPIIEEGRTLVPLRAIFEAFGMTVEWDGETSTITAAGQGNSIYMQVDQTTAVVNNKALSLDVPPRIVNGRTLVPVRFISESLNATVSWNAEDKIVNILN